MKLYLLAECVNRLAVCDINNPDDQKTISVCENYILQSYNLYLENCYQNNYEPLTQEEYMAELLCEGQFLNNLAAGAKNMGANIQNRVNTVMQSKPVQNVVQSKPVQGAVNTFNNAKTAVGNNQVVQKGVTAAKNAGTAVANNPTVQKGVTAAKNTGTAVANTAKNVGNKAKQAYKNSNIAGKKKQVNQQVANNTAPVQQAKQMNPVNETMSMIRTVLNKNSEIANRDKLSIANISFNEFLNMAIDCPEVSLASTYCILENVNEAQFNDILRETIDYNFNANKLSQPLTPAIKRPARFD